MTAGRRKGSLVRLLAGSLLAVTANTGWAAPHGPTGYWRDAADPGAWIQYHDGQMLEWLDGRIMSASPMVLRDEPDGRWIRFPDDPTLGERILQLDAEQLVLRRNGIQADIRLLRLLGASDLANGQRPRLATGSDPGAGGCSRVLEGFGYQASSTLAASANADYEPVRLLDGRTDTAWVEGKAEAGIGEDLRLDLQRMRLQSVPPGTDEGLQPIEAIVLEGLRLINGYPRSAGIYRANARVARLQLSLDDHPLGDWALADHDQPQVLSIQPPLLLRRDSRLVLSLAEVYPGERWQDTAIAELQPIVYGCAQILAVD